MAIRLPEETDSARWRSTFGAQKRGVGATTATRSVEFRRPASGAVLTDPADALHRRARFPDWSGYEHPPPTQNKLITHNLLIDSHVADRPRAQFDIIRGKDVKMMLANMNETARPAGQPGARCSPSASTTPRVSSTVWCRRRVRRRTQLNQPDGQHDRRPDRGDGYYIRGDWTLQGQLSYGMQKQAAITPDPVAPTGPRGTACRPLPKSVPRRSRVGRDRRLLLRCRSSLAWRRRGS